MKTLKKLFLDELADMYDSENRIAKALPKLIKAATCNELKAALENHLEETRGHIAQLEQVFADFDETARPKKCHAISGILTEGSQIASDNKHTPQINAAIISACQKVEHYEIASYGTLRAWAGIMGQEDAVNRLQFILDQEKEADHVLSDLALTKNAEAYERVPAGQLA